MEGTEPRVRVTRTLVYEYADKDTANKDMSRWSIHGTYRPNGDITITSTHTWEELPDE